MCWEEGLNFKNLLNTRFHKIEYEFYQSLQDRRNLKLKDKMPKIYMMIRNKKRGTCMISENLLFTTTTLTPNLTHGNLQRMN